MSHVAEGTLRRLLDEPAAIGDDGRDHVAGCYECGERLREVAADRDEVARRLAALSAGDRSTTGRQDAAGVDTAGVDTAGVDTAGVDTAGIDTAGVDAAWARLQAGLGSGQAGRGGVAPLVPVRSRRGVRARRPVVAAVAAAVVVLGGTAAAAAADWLPLFRTESVRPVSLSAQDVQLVDQLGRLPDLAAYGDVTSTDGRITEVPDAATAAARTGLAVPQPAALPRGVEGKPTYQVLERQTVEFTFSAAKARAAASATGAALPAIPPDLDGTKLRFEGGPAVAVTWRQAGAVPSLIVVRAKAPTAQSEGASLPVVRDYLLSIPGISPGLAAQLRSVTGDGTTLPIPVPKELATASQTQLDGVPATVIESKGHAAVGVVWVERGELNAVLGPLSTDEVLAVARGLH